MEWMLEGYLSRLDRSKVSPSNTFGSMPYNNLADDELLPRRNRCELLNFGAEKSRFADRFAVRH
jgi:hypothetical protein